LTRLLADSSDLLAAFGGHAYAAGLTVARDRLPALRERLETLTRERLDLEACVPRVVLDGDLAFASVDLDLVSWLERLPPHGLENAEPTFRAGKARVESSSRVGNGKHLRLWLRDGTGAAEAIGFGLGERAAEVAPG